MSFWKIFENRNKYNEKNIVGFLSFAMMTLFAVSDIATGLWGKELVAQRVMDIHRVLIKGNNKDN